MPIKWETEAEKIDVELLDTLLFKNNLINEFIYTDNKYFIVASKGIGKTLLLNYKRYKLEKKYGSDKDEKMVSFIPTKKPYLDFITDFGSLTKDQLKFLADWRNCKRLWELAIEISALSYYYKENRPIGDYFDSINEGMKKGFDWSIKTSSVNPTFVLAEFLRIKDTSANMKFIDNYSNRIRSEFTTIPSGIIIFIDRVDQSLITYSSEAWVAVQIGLLEASWDLMRMNHHVKIYTSIRQEAYSNYASPNKTSISGEVSHIKYTHSDLRGIIDTLSKSYEGKSYYGFIGFEKLTNLFGKKEEDSFEYAYRHTLGRPRDFASICSKLSPEKNNLTVDNFRNIVNDVSSTDIVTNIFSEVEILLDSFKDKNVREKFLALLPYNILSLNELKNVCREFHELPSCPPYKDCKKCYISHPFCELYNIGLLGIVKQNHLSTKPLQKFVEPYEMNQFSNWILPLDSPYYLVHPSLHYYIDTLRNKLVSSKYNLIRYIIIGNHYTWDEQNIKLIQAQKAIFEGITDEKTREQLLSILGAHAQPQSLISKLKEASQSIVDKSVEGARVIELIWKIYEANVMLH